MAARTPIRWLEAACAALMLWSFFLPWISFMGQGIAAHAIRERLEGPHRLASWFTAGTRVSADYHLSQYLVAVPLAAAAILILAALGRAPAWAGTLAGGLALAAALYVRGEAAHYPFQRAEYGVYVAMAAGLALAALSLGRLGMRFIRRG